MASKSSGAACASNRVVPETDANADSGDNCSGNCNGAPPPASAAPASPTGPPTGAAPPTDARPPSPVKLRSKGGSSRAGGNASQQKVFDSVRSAPEPPHAPSPGPPAGPPADLPAGSSSDVHGRRWKVLGKLAMLMRTADPVIEIYHETAAKDGSSRFMLHPNSKIRRFWEISTACCVLYVVTMVPLILGFNYVDWSVLSGFNTFIDWYFIVGTSVRNVDRALSLR